MRKRTLGRNATSYLKPAAFYIQNQTKHTTVKSLIPVGSPRFLQSTEVRIRHLQTKTSKSSDFSTRSIFNYVTKCAYKSRSGEDHLGNKKSNQDSVIISNSNYPVKDFFFAVCDGHGQDGREVSSFLKSRLPETLTLYLKFENSNDLASSIKQAIMTTEKSMLTSNVDASNSGSTLCSVVIRGDILCCCNVGDSRALLFSYDSVEHIWKYHVLSVDHVPTLPEEAERIVRSNGVIQADMDENGEPSGPLRVYQTNLRRPGLCMTRSIGDLTGKRVGVISEASDISVTLEKDHKAIIIASDGIWSVFTNEEVTQFISERILEMKIDKICDEITNEAVKRWKDRYGVVDDISVIIVCLAIT